MPLSTPRILMLALLVAATHSSVLPSQVWAKDSLIQLSEATRNQCYQVLRQALDAEEFWPSMHAAEAMTLGGKGDEVQKRLRPQLREEQDDQRRCGLARELVRAGDREKATVLLEILAGSDTYGHVHACESLYKVGVLGNGKLLRQAMRQTDDEIKALMAAAALGRQGDSEAFALIREQVQHEDPKISRIAAWILGRIGKSDDIPRLRAKAGQFDDALTRAYFDHALAALGDPAGLQSLEKNLSHADPQIRVYAATFALDARAAIVHERLVEMLEDENLDVRVRAAQSLLGLSQPAPGGPR